MKQSTKIGLSVGGAIVVSCICYGLIGLEGAVFGFIFTLLIIGLFTIWKKNTYLIYCLIGMYVIISYSYFIKNFNISFFPLAGLNQYELFMAYGCIPLVVLMLVFYRKRAD